MGLFDNAWATAEAGVGMLGAIPIAGEVINANQAVYHAGSAVYDGVTGDRDGAVNHGAQAVWSGIGAIPGVPETVGQVDAVASGLGTGARSLTTVAGGVDPDADATQVPGGIGDVLGSGAVMMTNALFGADDSNWIAEGNDPTGTRGGEIAAGMGLLGGLHGAALGSAMGPLGTVAGAAIGAFAGSQFGPWMGGLLGAETEGRTSGARGSNGETNWAQDGGDWLHRESRPGTWLHENRDLLLM